MKNKKTTRRVTRRSPDRLSADGLRAFQVLIGQGVSALARVGSELAVMGLEDRICSRRLRIMDRMMLEALSEEAAKQRHKGYREAARFIRGLIPDSGE